MTDSLKAAICNKMLRVITFGFIGFTFKIRNDSLVTNNLNIHPIHIKYLSA